MTNVAFHSTHWKGFPTKLLVVHLKGGWCNFWGLLHCDDRRSSWLASGNGPQCDDIGPDAFMVCLNCNSYASLTMFFIVMFYSLLFFYSARIGCVLFLYHRYTLYYRYYNLTEHDNIENLDCPFCFLLMRNFSSLFTSL